MGKAIPYCILIVGLGVVLALSASSPATLSDSNAFLKDFVGPELLAILAVIVSITLASTSSLHLELNKIEERHNTRAFHKTRAGIKQAAYWLVGLLVIAIGVVALKGGLPLSEVGQSVFNGIALLVLLWNVLILTSITQAVFAVPPSILTETSNSPPTSKKGGPARARPQARGSKRRT